MSILPKVRLKANVNFPSNVVAQNFLTITKVNGVFTLDVDYTKLAPTPVNDLSTSFVVVYDSAVGFYRSISLANLFNTQVSIEQHITAAGPVVVGNSTSIVRVDQTVGAPITLTMGASANKVNPVLISDWKGDASTNPITINLTGSDKFPGNLTSWTIGSDTGSILLKPISGVGYII